MVNDEIKKVLEKASENINEEEIGLNRIKDEEEKTIDEWKNTKVEDLKLEEFDTAKELIKVTIKGYSNGTILYGIGGIGKSYISLETIKEELKPSEWDYKTGWTTALSLYKYLHSKRNLKVIILDDVDLFQDSKIINLLKGALYESSGKRLVMYDTTSEKANDVPSVFEMKAKLIILCNRIPNKEDINVSALLSRTICYEINFSYHQKIEIINKILGGRKDLTQKQKVEIMQIIVEKTNEATNLNFRTLEKLIAYYKYDKKKAEKLFEETTEEDKKIKLFLEVQKKQFRSEKERVRGFVETSGYSPRTYYNIKKKLQNCSKK